MVSGPALILQTLDRHMTGPGVIRLFGGAAFILGFGRRRTTEDADLLLDDRECQALIDDSGFAEAVEATNLELEPQGLYLAHVFGPEQQVLAPGWRERCFRLELTGLTRLQVLSLSAVDLALTKLGRGDDADFEDVIFLLETGAVQGDDFRDAIARAVVPPEYAELFAAAKPKALALLR